jgi:uncharacterized membrane protein
MSRYEFLLTVHVLAAIAWLGAAVCVQLLAVRADRSQDAEQMRKIADDAEWLAARLFIPASLLVLVLGILLTLDGPWEFSQTWIILGLAGYAFSFLVGLLFISPESGRIHRLIGEQGAGHSEVRRRIKRIFLVSRVELVILVLVVVVMIVKPGL